MAGKDTKEVPVIENFTGAMFEGFLDLPGHPVCEAFNKLGSLLPNKESYQLGVFQNSIIGSSEGLTYKDKKNKLQKKLGEWQKEEEKKKREDVEKKVNEKYTELSDKDKRVIIDDKMKAFRERLNADIPLELSDAFTDLARMEVESIIEGKPVKFKPAKHPIDASKIKEWEIDEKKMEKMTIDEIKEILGWNLSHAERRRLEPYIDFQWKQ